MDTHTNLGFQELITALVGNMTRAVSERNGDTPQQRLVRVQAGCQMIMAFLPRDVIEAMLAGHCVMFHELLTDSVRWTLRGAADPAGRAMRSNVALNKAFFANLDRFEQYRKRVAEGRRDEPEARAEARPDDRTPQPVAAQTPARAAATQPVPAAPAHPETSAVRPPSPAAIAAVSANPVAMAALNAGDPAAFALALGVDPSEAFLAAAAAPGSPFRPGSNGPWPEYAAKEDRKPNGSGD